MFICVLYKKQQFTLCKLLLKLEVPPGFEPGNEGFADLCLTTWLWHHKKWSGRRDSDSRPPPWQGGALPTELLPQNDGDRRRQGKQALMKTGAGEETRTHTPVAPDPKSGASAIPPRPHAAYDPHGASAPDSQIRTLIYYTLSAGACQYANANFFQVRPASFAHHLSLQTTIPASLTTMSTAASCSSRGTSSSSARARQRHMDAPAAPRRKRS